MRDAQSGTPGNQQMVEVFAAGNDGDGIAGSDNEGYGSIHAEGSAKNVITVGASEGVRADRNGRLRHDRRERQQRRATSPTSPAAGRPTTGG